MEVNMKDIARHAGVSVSTVSRVLNGQGYIRQETREKVLRAIEKYHYIPNNSARNLKREAVKAVGIVVKGFSNPFFVRMLDVVQRVLEEKGYLMYLHPIDPLEDEVEEAVSLVKEKKPMGILFLGGNFEHGREKLDLLSVPYVMLAMMMNRDRVEDSRFPDTVKGVITQPGQYSTKYATVEAANAIQATDSKNGTYYYGICEDSVKAAMMGQVEMPSNVLYQANFSQGKGVWKSVYFNSGWYASTSYFCYG